MSLTLAFFEPDDQDHLINKVSTRLSGGRFAHVELWFSRYKESLQVFQGMNIMLKKKSYGRSGWRFVKIGCDSEKLYRAYIYTQKKLVGKSFGFGAFLRALTPFPAASDNDKNYFCSQAIVLVLQHINILPSNIVASCVTPTYLFEILEPKYGVTCSPHVVKRINAAKLSLPV